MTLILSKNEAKEPQSVAERPILDLSYRQFDRLKVPYRAIGTWLRQKPYRPCMVLVPANRALHHSQVRPCIIVLDDAWQWTSEAWAEHKKSQSLLLPGERSMGPEEACVFRIIHWFHMGYLPGSPHSTPDIFRLLDFIQDNLTYLLSMPPDPIRKDKRQVAGDVTFTRADGLTIKKDIWDDV